MYSRQAAFGFLRRFRHSSQTTTSTCRSGSRNRLIQTVLSPSKSELSYQHNFGSRNWRQQQKEFHIWIFLAGQAAVVFGLHSSPVLAEDVSVESNPGNDALGVNFSDLRKIEDGSVISNVHTSKWRVFTDKGREFFLQGKLGEAENFFLSALQEAKEGFGEKDPHVASALNNLAELYRVKKAFDLAEPFYIKAVKILEESFGLEDIRVAAALHNLGQFYLVQRKLEDARLCYERALKIKRRVLGHAHADYADTMFHLGTVLHLQGKEKDAETLIQDSIRILEEGGQGESMTCIRRLRYLAQIYIKSNRLTEAENMQRRILHLMELSQGWNSLDTIVSAEGLGLTLQSVGGLKEAKYLLERCLEARKNILPEDHVQVASNMLHLAWVEMLNSDHVRKTNTYEAMAELERAREYLGHSIRIAQKVLYKSAKQGDKKQNAVTREFRKDGHAALVILLRSLSALGLLEIKEHGEDHSSTLRAENAFHQCISVFKEFSSGRSLSNSPDIKAEYLSCLKHLRNLLVDNATNGTQLSKQATLQELEDEIKFVESEIPRKGKFQT